MKRIDKPAIDKPGVSQSETAQAEHTLTESARTASANEWAEAWTQQINRSGEIYGRLFAGMRDELATFMQKRLEANMEAACAWSACRSVNEALELQQNWLRCCFEQYSGEGTKLSELCRNAVFQAEPEATPATRDEIKAAPERKPATHEPLQSQVQRAAE